MGAGAEDMLLKLLFKLAAGHLQVEVLSAVIDTGVQQLWARHGSRPGLGLWRRSHCAV